MFGRICNMHTSEMKSGVVFNHNGGYFGEVLISAPDSEDPSIRHTVRVDFNDLMTLVADAVRSEKISKLEQMDSLGILEL